MRFGQPKLGSNDSLLGAGHVVAKVAALPVGELQEEIISLNAEIASLNAEVASLTTQLEECENAVVTTSKKKKK